MISLAITTFNRYEMTKESFAQVIDDPRIDDIVILDDCSTDGSYQKLVEHFKSNEKVRVIRQAQNRGMSLNKRDAVALSKNEWVVLFDSDNTIGTQYINAFLKIIPSHKTCIFCPSFARPAFDYRKYTNFHITKQNVYSVISDDTGNCLLNTCNYVVHRDTYLSVYNHNQEMQATDTVWFNYLWLNAGNSFYVVPDMEYYHRQHPGSGFLQDVDYNMKRSEEVRKLIMNL